MEFQEKLQELRKQRGLTQEELAKELYVSRTAISKWESGRGYPSIDSLKEISRFFSVTIDDLLSSEELITAAKDENESNIRGVYRLLFGITDIMTLVLVLLPLYPDERGGHINSVTLWQFSRPIALVYWILFGALFFVGIADVVMNQRKAEKGQSVLAGASLLLSVTAVLFLIISRVPYAAVMMFLLLAAKGVFLYKTSQFKGR